MSKQLGIRIDDDTIERINTYLKRLKTEPGRSTATQGDAVRVLLDFGLRQVEQSAPKKRAR